MFVAVDWMFDSSLWPAYFVAGLVTCLALCPCPKSKLSLDVPTVKFSRFLPNFLNRLWYFVDAPALIQYGYTHYAGQPFQILKPDGDLIILPHRYMDEFKSMPPSKISLLHAQHRNVLGEYINILLDSELPAFTVAKKLTPALNRIVPRTIDELKNAFPTVIPKCKDRWVSVCLYDMILSIMSRTSSRIIVGEDLCRDESWLNLLVRYTNNVGITIVLLRPFPNFLRPLVARWLPSVRMLGEQLAYATDKLFVPMITARRLAEQTDPSYQKPDDFVQWMMDAADNDFDRKPEVLSQGVMAIIALAAVHTSTMLTTQAIYDLILMPDVLEPLRKEISETLKDGWDKTTQAQLFSLRRMDSFLRESHRFNPNSEVTFQRIVLEDLTLSDGFTLPKGSHICFPSGPMSRDSTIIENATTFDPWRWCNGNGKDKDAAASPNYLVTINRANMHFGYGRQACPGRFYATNNVKALLSRFLMEYDFKFEGESKRRPRNLTNGEHIMPNMRARVLIRERGVA